MTWSSPPSGSPELPPVTALIPAYNAARTLERALASVWAQDYPAIEILVVDDASTDGTGEVARRFADRGVRVVTRDKNGGESGSMNTGIRAAAHDYIAFLDADDEWLPGKLRRQMPIIAGNADLTFISCGGHDQLPDGRINEFGRSPPPHIGREFWRSLLVYSYVAKPTVIARRQALIDVGYFDESLTIGADQDMWLKLARKGSVAFVPENLIRIHPTPGSLMMRFGDRSYELVMPMIRRHLAELSDRMSPAEINDVLARRYAQFGRNMYARGNLVRGAGLVLRAVMSGNDPVSNLLFLVAAAPPVIALKKFLGLSRR